MIGYIARRVFSNNMNLLKVICTGGSIMDEEMNPIRKTSLERLQYMELSLELPEYNEMFYYAGRELFLDDIFENVKELMGECLRDGYSKEEIAQQIKWLDKLVMWAISSVHMLRTPLILKSAPKNTNSNDKDTPVTISGFVMGMFVTVRMAARILGFIR